MIFNFPKLFKLDLNDFQSEIIVTIFIIFFGLIGIKLNDITNNFYIGEGIDNSFKSEFINIIISLYFWQSKKVIQKDLDNTMKMKHENFVVNNMQIENEDKNEGKDDNNINIENLPRSSISKNANNVKIENLPRSSISKNTNKINISVLNNLDNDIINNIILNDYLIYQSFTERIYYLKAYDLNNILNNNYIDLSSIISKFYPIINAMNLVDLNSIININLSTNTADNNNSEKFNKDHINKEEENQLKLVSDLNYSINNSNNTFQFISFSGDLSCHHILKIIENYFTICSNKNKEREKKISLITSSVIYHKNYNTLDNITSGFNSEEFRRLIDLQPNHMKTLYKKILEIVNLNNNSSQTMQNRTQNEEDDAFFQKVSLARNLFLDPDILLIDEIIYPMNNEQLEILNTYFSSEIYKSKSRIVICASNNYQLLKFSKLNYFVTEGIIKEKCDSFVELKQKNNLFKNYYLNRD